MSDESKPKLSRIPLSVLPHLARVQEYGDGRPGREPYDWERKRDPEPFVNAALRHIIAYMDGEWVDEESGHLALAHAAESLLIALHIHAKHIHQPDAKPNAKPNVKPKCADISLEADEIPF